MKRLRLAMVTRRFWPLTDGAGTYLARLAVELQEQGALATIITAGYERHWPHRMMYQDVPVIRIEHLSRRLSGELRYMRSLGRWMAQHGREFDVVCVSEMKYEAYAVLQGLAPRDAPIVLRAESGDESDCHWQDSTRFGRRIRRQCQRAEAVVASTRGLCEELQLAGYAPERIHLIRHGAPSADRPTPALRILRRGELAEANGDLAILDLAPLVVYAGRLTASEHLTTLIRAFRAVAQAQPSSRLWLIGEGPDRAVLLRSLADLGLHQQVVMPGSFDDCWAVLQAADLCVFPANTERIDVPLLDAMALGLPVIASDSPSNRCVIRHQIDGWLASATDVASWSAAMTTILNDPALARRLGTAARLRAQQEFSLAEAAASHLALFRRLLQKSE